MISEVPPVANGTTKRIDFSGYSAHASEEQSKANTVKKNFKVHPFDLLIPKASG